jgi:hypothetical protein
MFGRLKDSLGRGRVRRDRGRRAAVSASAGYVRRVRLCTRRRLVAAVVAAVLAAAIVAVARADYWNFSGYCDQYQTCGSDFPGYFGYDYEHRLSREYCGTKMYEWDYDGIPHIQPAPLGCASSDWTAGPFSHNDYEGGFCQNDDGPTMWVNCRIAPT